VVIHGVGDIRRNEVEDPVPRDPAGTTIRVTASAILDTEPPFVRGTVGP
jgi:hypothetical protein